MSGIETLGILASATQLAAYSIKIVLHLDETYTAVQKTSTRITRYFNQVRELIEITTLIEQQTSLWSSKVHRQLQATLSEAQSLYDLLREQADNYKQSSIWKYWSILRGIAETEILSSLDSLEREKSTLRICIDTVHIDLLLDIKGSIDSFSCTRMWGKPPFPQNTVSVADKGSGNTINSKPPATLKGKGKEIPNSQTAMVHVQASSSTAAGGSQEGHRYKGKVSVDKESSQHAGDQGANPKTVKFTTSSSTAAGGSQEGHRYMGKVTVDKKSSQHAGDQGADPNSKRHTYEKDASCQNKSVQVLGNLNDAQAIAGWAEHIKGRK